MEADVEAATALLRSQEQQLAACSSLRRTCLGTDRHHRRYWLLGGRSAGPASTGPHPGWLFRETPPAGQHGAPSPAPSPAHAQAPLASPAANGPVEGAQAPGATTGPGGAGDGGEGASAQPMNGLVGGAQAPESSAGPSDGGGGGGGGGGAPTAPSMALYGSAAAVDALVGWLNPQGRREGPLRQGLLHYRKLLAAHYPEVGAVEAAAQAELGVSGAAAGAGEEHGRGAGGRQGSGGGDDEEGDGAQAMEGVEGGEAGGEEGGEAGGAGDGAEAMEGVEEVGGEGGGGAGRGPGSGVGGGLASTSAAGDGEDGAGEEGPSGRGAQLQELRRQVLALRDELADDLLDPSRSSVWPTWRSSTAEARHPAHLLAALLVRFGVW